MVPDRARSPARGPSLYKKKKRSFLLEAASFGPDKDQEHSQGSRSVLKTAHFCLRTASFLGPHRARSPARGPGLYYKQLISAWEHLVLGPHRAQEPSQGSRSVLKKKKTAHFCLRTASFVPNQDQEPRQGSRSVLKSSSFLLANSFCWVKAIHFCLRTASFGSTEDTEPSQGFSSVLKKNSEDATYVSHGSATSPEHSPRDLQLSKWQPQTGCSTGATCRAQQGFRHRDLNPGRSGEG